MNISKKIKRTLALGIALTCIPQHAPLHASGFTDISDHWAKGDIEYMYNANLISGMDEHTFAPDATLTRAEFATMLSRTLGLTPNVYAFHYSDVSPIDDWFAPYVGACVDAELIPDSVFAYMPDTAISRGEVAELLYRALEHEGLTESTPSKSVSYTDVLESSPYYEPIMVASAFSLIQGNPDNSFAPDSTLTRAEACTVNKRLSLVASTLSSLQLPVNISSGEGFQVNNEGFTLSGNLSYVCLSDVDFHSELNRIRATVDTTASDLRVEVWIDSLDTLMGTHLGTLFPSSQSDCVADIDRATGTHDMYLRLVGNGSLTVNNIFLETNALDINLSKYSHLYGMKRSGSTITNLKPSGYIDFDNVKFGDGYNMIELSMTNSVAGQLIEIWLDGEKVSVVETPNSGNSPVTVSTPIIKAENTKTLTIRPAMNVDGSITRLRLFNETPKAGICLDATQAITDVSLIATGDTAGTNDTIPLRNGDTLRFNNVNLLDGFNVLSVRMKDDAILNSSLTINTDGVDTGHLMGLYSKDDNAYLEVRLDGEDGALVGTIKPNMFASNSIYDFATGYLNGATGVHDIFLKVVGDLGWSINYIKLLERGWYDSPILTLEAEDMVFSGGSISDCSDPANFAPHTITSEASGKSCVKLIDSSSYISFTVPEYYHGDENSTSIMVRHSINDAFDDATNSVGRRGTMDVYVNDVRVDLIDSFTNRTSNSLTLSSECSRGYGKNWGSSAQALKQNTYSGFYFNDAYAVLPGTIEPGDVIKLVPSLTDGVEYCYVDCIDLENISVAKPQPQGYLSITECGAIANDGLDDGIALRKAVDLVKDAPNVYQGVWIPEGMFDIYSYVGGRNATAADFSGIRVLGAGTHRAQLRTHLGTWTQWCANYNTSENTVIFDVALHSESIARAWGEDGKGISAIAITGTGANFIQNVWFDHWNANIWLSDGAGVFYKNRIKNSWADGINIHDSGYGIVYAKSFFRGTGDDALAIFSDCTNESNMTRNVEIRNNTIVSTWWASGITIWGGEDIDIENNLVTDTAIQSGIALNSWGWNTPATDHVWIRNNRIERCGNANEGNQDNGALGMTPGYHSDDYNSIYRNTYFENNECIDNPSVFMRISSQHDADDTFMDIRYNYIRNTCLAFPERRRMVDWHTPNVRGKVTFVNNVLEGDYATFKTSNTTKLTEELIGNIPSNWVQK